MSKALTHRGPDDEGTHTDPQTGFTLGARRLSIIDVAGGHQPLCTPDESTWAVLNGEIYNYPALRQNLLRAGHQLQTHTDTEVLIHLYEDYGDDLVHALEGMYAFAVWDSRRRRLLLGRDRFGEKPLFYTHRNGDLVFASELTALRAGVDDPWTIDPAAIDDVLRLGYVVQPRTMVKEARQLPPAHRLVWDHASRGITIERYWSLPKPPLTVEASDRDLIDETHRLLRESVRARLIADVPLGVLLSGGVDSSLVAALAAEASTAPVRTFTVGYTTGLVDETPAARRVAEALGTDHTEVVLSTGDVVGRIPTVLGALDQPLADQALVALHCVCEAARKSVTVAVGGEGADELFGGYPRFQWLVRGERLRQLIPAPVARGAAAMLGSMPLPGRLHRVPTVLEPLTPLERHLRWIVGDLEEARATLYGPRLRDQLTRALSLALDGGADGDLAAAFMQLDRDVWLPDDVLAKSDRSSMLVSLELRTPMLSRAVAEFAASVPTRTHLRSGGKHLLRAVLGRILPAEVRPRGKTAFRVPAADWLRGPLRPTLDGIVRRSRLLDEGWLDRTVLSGLVAEHARGVRDHSAVLWPAMALALWLERFQAC